MIIDDLRGKNKQVDFKDLEYGEVYVSHRHQKYMMFTQEDCTVCLHTGEVFDEDEHNGDVFTHCPKAKVVID